MVPRNISEEYFTPFYYSLLFRQRAKEMWDCIHQLESEKFDLTDKMKRQKYEVSRITKNLQNG